MTGRITVAVVILAVALCTYPGAVVAALATRLTAAPQAQAAPAEGLPWLHVEHPTNGRPFIADDQGRLVLLHAIIPAGLIDYWTGRDQSQPNVPPAYPIDPSAYDGGACPPNASTSKYPPLCQDDITQMAALGFDAIRLPISWSLLEPQRGRFSEMYVDRIAQVVDWARTAGMYVIIDMHQNAYSRYVGAGTGVDLGQLSGAPQWATLTDGLPSRVFLKQREVNPAVLEADSNFWYDRSGIQDEYIQAIAFVARRFKDDSTVAGYSVFNEPWPGWNLPPGFEDLLLFPFYRRVIDALTGAHDGLPCWTGFFMPAACGYRDLGVDDVHHLIFVDTGLLREVTDFPTHLGLPLSSYPNVVLSMHAYTHVYTFDAFLGQKPDHATYPWGGYKQSYAWADREARAMNAALFVAEFGESPQWDSVVASQLEEQERQLTGSAFWVWKENGDANWGMFATPSPRSLSSGCLRAGRERLLARVYLRATAATDVTYRYDPTTAAFVFAGRGRSSDPQTVIHVPSEVTGAVSAAGAAQVAEISVPDGSREVLVTTTGGDFSVSVAPANLKLTGCG